MELNLKSAGSHNDCEFFVDSSVTSGPTFYARMGPFFASRAVHKELGGPFFDSEKHVWIIAVTGGRVVGFGCLNSSKLSTGDIWYDAVYVVPEHRRKGIYTKINGILMSMAEASTARRVRAATNNPIVQKVLERSSFKSYQQRGSWTYYEKVLK